MPTSKRAYAFLSNFSTCVVIILSGMLLALLSLCTFLSRSNIAMDASEHTTYAWNSPLFMLALVFSLVLVVWLRPYLDRIAPSHLFAMVAIIQGVIAFYLIFNCSADLRSDASMVYLGAQLFSQGDFSLLEPGAYLANYPHQLGLLSFQRIFLFYTNHVLFYYFLNFLMVLAIEFIQWKLTELLFHNSTVCRYNILLSLFFLPQVFFILFVYGEIPGLLFLILSVYCAAKFFLTNRPVYFIISLLSIAEACLIRSNNIIGAIALALVYLLHFLNAQRLRSLIAIPLILVLVVLPPKLLTNYYENVSGMEIGPGLPKILWVAMGLEDSPLAPGWFNNYAMDTYEAANLDGELAAEMAEQEIAQRVKTFVGDPAYAASFFGRKILSTWCEPTFQSAWSGPLEDCGQYTRTPLTQSIFRGEGAFHVLQVISHIALFLLYFPSLVYLLCCWKRKRREEKGPLPCGNASNIISFFPYIYLLGGFLFHLFWETKSQYVYPYVYFLAIPASTALTLLADHFKPMLSFLKQKFLNLPGSKPVPHDKQHS